MQGDDLVAEDVVASGDAAGDGHGPAVVVGDQVVGGPGTGGTAAIDETALADLEPLEGGLVDGRAVAVAAGEVVDDGAVVALGPLSPLQLNLSSGLDRSRELGVLGILVADDVGVGVAVGLDEAQVRGLLRPSDNIRGAGVVRVVVDQVSSVVRAVGDDSLDEAVGRGHGRGGEGQTSSSSDRHFLYW